MQQGSTVGAGAADPYKTSPHSTLRGGRHRAISSRSGASIHKPSGRAQKIHTNNHRYMLHIKYNISKNDCYTNPSMAQLCIHHFR